MAGLRAFLPELGNRHGLQQLLPRRPPGPFLRPGDAASILIKLFAMLIPRECCVVFADPAWRPLRYMVGFASISESAAPLATDLLIFRPSSLSSSMQAAKLHGGVQAPFLLRAKANILNLAVWVVPRPTIFSLVFSIHESKKSPEGGRGFWRKTGTGAGRLRSKAARAQFW